MRDFNRQVTQSVIDRFDFDETFYSTFNQTEAPDDNPGAAQYFYDEATNTASLNPSGSTTFTGYRYEFKNVRRGDVVNLTGYIQNVSNSYGCTFDIQEIDELGEIAGITIARKLNVPQDGNWTLVDVTVPFRNIEGVSTIRVFVGNTTFSGSSGLFRLRDIKIGLSGSLGEKTSTPSIKNEYGCAIRSGGSWSPRTDWFDSGFSVSENALTVAVIFDKPFNKKPIVSIGDITKINGPNGFFPHIYDVTVTGFEVMFRTAAGAIVYPPTYIDDMFFQFQALGEY